MFPTPLRSAGTLLPSLGLILATSIWGSMFFMIKKVTTELPVFDFLGWRFVLTAVFTFLIFRRRVLWASKTAWWYGLALACLYVGAQYLESIGLASVDASVSGFITGMYAVITPVLLLLMYRQPPQAHSYLHLCGSYPGTGDLVTARPKFWPRRNLYAGRFRVLLAAHRIVRSLFQAN
ncbi:DMT family transporter [Winkia neuii]|uniref:EamA family transporter n=1 Tax=Winkia neuii TaxID=33007 RepID=A0A2I1ILJ6_9ACTO|nr:hypothetical protein HMPREF2851_09840 [Actinomyces sp. HMSC064C12]PKY72004.1 EamA family transporter [Winkia neuii]